MKFTRKLTNHVASDSSFLFLPGSHMTGDALDSISVIENAMQTTFTFNI